MGYTHYYYRPEVLDEVRFGHFSQDAKQLALAWEGPIAYEFDDPDKPPEFSLDQVRFNGIGDDGRETFLIERVFTPPDWRPTPDEEGHFDCCKTARKPYDVLVCAVLIAFKHHFPEVTIASGGNWNGYDWLPRRWNGKEWVADVSQPMRHETEWQDGRALYRRVFPDRDAETSILRED